MKIYEKIQKHRTLLILVFINFCAWTTLMAAFPIVPVLVKILHTDSSNIGGILGFASLVMLVLNIPAGVFSDLYGRRPFIIVGLLLLTLSSLGVYLSGSTLFFFAAWTIGGIGRGLFLSPAFAIVGDMYASRERATAMGMLTAAIGIGSVNGYVLGGLIGGGANWKILFLVISVINFIGFILSFYIFETCPKVPKQSLRKAFLSTLLIFSDRNIRLLTLITLFTFGTAVSVTFLIPFLAESISISISSLAFFFIPYEVFAVVTSIIIGRIADKYGRKGSLVSILVLVCLSLFGLSFCPISYVSILIFYTVISLCEGPLLGLTGTMVTDITIKKEPQEIGSTLGSFRTIYSLGAVLGPWLGGYLSKNVLLKDSFLIISVLIVISLCLSLFVTETLDKEIALHISAK